MSKDTTMQYPLIKSISQHQSWQVFEHPYDNSLHAYSWTQTIPLIQSLRATWQSEDMSHKELELELTQEEYEDLVQKSEVEKFNIQESFHSSRNLKQQLEVAPKTESEVEVQQSISQSGTKKSKISLSSRIIKARKTIELGS